MKRKNTKQKGNRNENKSRKILEGMGYQVTRSARSEGVFDLIAINQFYIVLVQVKTRDWPSKEEMERIEQFKCPSNCAKVVHRWRDGESRPDTRTVQLGQTFDVTQC